MTQSKKFDHFKEALTLAVSTAEDMREEVLSVASSQCHSSHYLECMIVLLDKWATSSYWLRDFINDKGRDLSDEDIRREGGRSVDRDERDYYFRLLLDERQQGVYDCEKIFDQLENGEPQ